MIIVMAMIINSNFELSERFLIYNYWNSLFKFIILTNLYFLCFIVFVVFLDQPKLKFVKLIFFSSSSFWVGVRFYSSINSLLNGIRSVPFSRLSSIWLLLLSPNEFSKQFWEAFIHSYFSFWFNFGLNSWFESFSYLTSKEELAKWFSLFLCS